MTYDDNLFYTCSLIEYIARVTKNSRKDLISYLKPDIKRIYSHADVFHCEPIEKVADDFIQRNHIPMTMRARQNTAFRIIGISERYFNG